MVYDMYIEFIGDGDSSVYPTVISSLPWGFAIKKLECSEVFLLPLRTWLTVTLATKERAKAMQKGLA